jgi:hypothetical protein
MRPEFKFGLGAGLVWWLWMAIELALGFHSTRLQAGEYSSWMLEVIQFGMIVLLLRATHRQLPLGRLEPWDAALKSLVVSAIFAALVFIGMIACVDFIDPDRLMRMLTWKVAQMRAAGVSEESLRTYIVATRQAYSPLGLARSCFVITPLVGAVMGVLICIALNSRWEKANLAQR